MTQIVTEPRALTPEWFTFVLQSSSALAPGSAVTEVTLEPIGGGLMSRSQRAGLSYDDDRAGPPSVVVKYPTDDEGSFGLAQATRMYELEVAFYRDVAPLLTARVPGCHLAEHDPSTGMFTLVLEDVGAYARAGDVLTLCTLDQAADVLGELVGLQAPTWNNPRLQALGWLADNAGVLGMFDQFPLGLEPFIERFQTALDPQHIKLFESVLPQSGAWVRSWQPPTVIQHGDFRTDNLMFAERDGAPPVTVIDFQTVRLGPPGLDVAYFIGASLSADDRRSGDEDLLREYHQRLLSAGVEGFDFEACWQSYREGALYGVFLFVGLASQVESTERGDRVIAEQIKRYAEMAIDLEAPQAAGLA